MAVENADFIKEQLDKVHNELLLITTEITMKILGNEVDDEEESVELLKAKKKKQKELITQYDTFKKIYSSDVQIRKLTGNSISDNLSTETLKKLAAMRPNSPSLIHIKLKKENNVV